MRRQFALGIVLSIALVSCVSSPTLSPTPTRESLPTPTSDPLSYSTDPEAVVLEVIARTHGGAPEYGRPCAGIVLFRVWGAGRVVRVRHEQDGRQVASGQLDPTGIHDLLVLLDGLGSFAPATPDSPNPAGTYCDLELNLKAGTLARSWSGVPPLCVQLLARVDAIDLAPFVPQQALLLTRPYESNQPPTAELPEWPIRYGFSLGQIPESGRWVTGDVLAFAWEEVNRHDAPYAGFREGEKAYAVAVRVPGTIDQPFDCTLGRSNR